MSASILRIILQAEPTVKLLVPSARFLGIVFWKGVSIMCRKIAIAVGAVLLGLVIVSYTSLPSLCHVKWNDGMAWLDRPLPIETKIKQHRIESDQIDNHS